MGTAHIQAPGCRECARRRCSTGGGCWRAGVFCSAKPRAIPTGNMHSRYIPPGTPREPRVCVRWHGTGTRRRHSKGRGPAASARPPDDLLFLPGGWSVVFKAPLVLQQKFSEGAVPLFAQFGDTATLYWPLFRRSSVSRSPSRGLTLYQECVSWWPLPPPLEAHAVFCLVLLKFLRSITC